MIALYLFRSRSVLEAIDLITNATLTRSIVARKVGWIFDRRILMTRLNLKFILK